MLIPVLKKAAIKFHEAHGIHKLKAMVDLKVEKDKIHLLRVEVFQNARRTHRRKNEARRKTRGIIRNEGGGFHRQTGARNHDESSCRRKISKKERAKSILNV